MVQVAAKMLVLKTRLLMRPALDLAEFLWWAGLYGLAAELE
jgi:hypothetical protein